MYTLSAVSLFCFYFSIVYFANFLKMSLKSALLPSCLKGMCDSGLELFGLHLNSYYNKTHIAKT